MIGGQLSWRLCSALVSGLEAELRRLGYKDSTLVWYRGCWRRMGHSSIAGTDYYLRLTAESYPHITAAIQRAFGDIVAPLTAGLCDGD